METVGGVVSGVPPPPPVGMLETPEQAASASARKGKHRIRTGLTDREERFVRSPRSALIMSILPSSARNASSRPFADLREMSSPLGRKISNGRRRLVLPSGTESGQERFLAWGARRTYALSRKGTSQKSWDRPGALYTSDANQGNARENATHQPRTPMAERRRPERGPCFR